MKWAPPYNNLQNISFLFRPLSSRNNLKTSWAIATKFSVVTDGTRKHVFKDISFWLIDFNGMPTHLDLFYA